MRAEHNNTKRKLSLRVAKEIRSISKCTASAQKKDHRQFSLLGVTESFHKKLSQHRPLSPVTTILEDPLE